MTTLATPVSKLYKRCAWKHHAECPGHFDYTNGQTYSVCSCDCHAGVSDMRAAAIVAEAETIIRKLKTDTEHADGQDVRSTPQISNVETAKTLGTTPLGGKVKTSGLSTKTDKYAKWANAIVAKNARIRIAADESEKRRGVTPAILGMAANRILAPRCVNCGHRQIVKWVDEHSFDSDVTVVACSCKKGGE